MEIKNCKHLKAFIVGDELCASLQITCPDCKEHVPLMAVINNLLKVMRKSANIEEYTED